MKGFELFRKFFGKKERSAQSLTGAAGLTQNGVLTEGHGEVVFFIVSPSNISVLSREAVGEKVGRLAALFSSQGDIEIFCADARENFGNNMTYLDGRIREEKNEKVRELLLRDRAFLEEMQNRMSTSREFLFIVRFGKGTGEESFSTLNRIEKSINDLGFACRRAEKEDVKRIVAGYFGVRSAGEIMDEYDGESAAGKWIIED